MHEPLSNLRKILFVQFAPGVPRTEIWRALHGAATLQADIGKYVIGISEDIDPDNLDAVFWSLAYRTNPVEDVFIAPYRSAGHSPKSGGGGEDSTMLDILHSGADTAEEAVADAEFRSLVGERIREFGLTLKDKDRVIFDHRLRARRGVNRCR